MHRKIYFTLTPDSQKSTVPSNWYRASLYLGEIGFSYSWEVMSDFMPDLLLSFAKHCLHQPLSFISQAPMRWPWLDYLHEQDKLQQAVICAARYPVWAGGHPHQLGAALGTQLSRSSNSWAGSNRENAGKSRWRAWLQMLPHSLCPNFHCLFTTVKVRIYSGHIAEKWRELSFLLLRVSGGNVF